MWQNPDQERTNQNARIYLKTTLPYNNVVNFLSQLISDFDYMRFAFFGLVSAFFQSRTLFKNHLINKALKLSAAFP